MEKLTIYDSLPYGRENAIPCKQLAQILGYSSVRALQNAVEMERAAGAVILCASDGSGYYRSEDPAEILRFIQVLSARAAHTFKAIESAKRALNKIAGQLSIDGVEV